MKVDGAGVDEEKDSLVEIHVEIGVTGEERWE